MEYDGCQCFQNPCVCEEATPELRAKMLALYPGDPAKPIGPVTREMEIALAAKGIFAQRIKIRPDGSIEVLPDEVH